MNNLNITLDNEIQRVESNAPIVSNKQAPLQLNGANSTQTDNICLSDTFTYYKSKLNVLVELHKECIKFFNFKNNSPMPTPSLTLKLADICGSRVAKGHFKNDHRSYLTIYAYIGNIENLKKIKQRKRLSIDLTCMKYSSYEENIAQVNHWSAQLDILSKSNLCDSLIRMKNENKQQDSNEAFNTSSNDTIEFDYNSLYEQFFKPFLVLINPKAGSGKAKNIYFERVVPVWSESNQQNKMVYTQHANFAHEYIQTIKLDDYRGIVVISGDGLIYEVINGLMSRPDWQQAIKMPIAQIPGGSANALACVSAYLTNECYKNISMEKLASQTAFNMTKSIPCPLDLVTYHLSNNKFVHSFLAFEWAIVADIDLESEKYRFLGGFRFTVGAINRILNLRLYRGRLSFLLFDESQIYTPKNTSIKLIQNNSPDNPNTTINNSKNEDETTNIQLNDRPAFKYLPNSLDDPVPSNWITIEDNFVFFLITYLPLIAPDFMATPESTFNDKCMHLLFIKEGITKRQLLQLFTMTENGEHLSSPFVEYVKIKAFRLEPLPLNTRNTNKETTNSHDGVMMVDGERVPYGKVQAEIFPGLGNILANKKI